MSSRRHWIILFAFILPLLLPGGILHAESETPEDPSGRFGVIEAYDAPEAAGQLGVSWTRAKFHWGLIQPEGPDDWVSTDMDDEELAGELNAGREVIGLIIGIPDWARDPNNLPSGYDLPYDDPENLWAVFVNDLVSHYEGRINHWIIWNEPDIWDTTHPACTWHGTESDFVMLLKSGYLAAKAANPDAVIHLPAMTHWWDASYDRELYFNRLLNALIADPEAPDNDYFYDIATMHVYFNAASPFELLELYSQLQADHGLDKPFWLIETNAAPNSDPARIVDDVTFRISMTEQAAYMPQAIAGALTAGAERIGFFKLIDTPGDLVANPEPFGLVREDGSYRPAFLTTVAAINILGAAESVEWVNREEVSQFVAYHPDHVTRIIWSRLPVAMDVLLPGLSDSPEIRDMWGNSIDPGESINTIDLTLPGAECQETVGNFCMIGGPVIYITDSLDSVSEEKLALLDMISYQPAELHAREVKTKLSGWLSASLAFVSLALITFFGGMILNNKLDEKGERDA